MKLITALGQQAHEHLKSFEKFCTKEEFKTLEEGVKTFDTDLTGCGFHAIQAKLKLTSIKELTFKEFQAVMLVYFGKEPSEYIY